MIDLPEELSRELECVDPEKTDKLVTACKLKGEVLLIELAGKTIPSPDHELVKKLFHILRNLVSMADVPKVTRVCSYDRNLIGEDKYNLARRANRLSFSENRPRLEGRANTILGFLMDAVHTLITPKMFKTLMEVSPKEMNIGFRSGWVIVATPDHRSI